MTTSQTIVFSSLKILSFWWIGNLQRFFLYKICSLFHVWIDSKKVVQQFKRGHKFVFLLLSFSVLPNLRQVGRVKSSNSDGWYKLLTDDVFFGKQFLTFLGVFVVPGSVVGIHWSIIFFLEKNGFSVFSVCLSVTNKLFNA